MSRILPLIISALMCFAQANAQFDIKPKGPFTRLGLAQAVFVVVLTDPNVSAEYYRWTLYTNDGGTYRVLDSLQGEKADVFSSKPLRGNLIPANPEPQLAVTVTLRNKFSPTPYSVTRVFPIQFTEAIYALIEPDGKGNYFITPSTRTIGRREQGEFGIARIPPTSSYISLMLLGSNGDTLKKMADFIDTVKAPFIHPDVIYGFEF
jgi:hypothetical protein